MNKDAGLYIPFRVYVEEIPAPRNASSHIGSIIPEVNNKKRLLGAYAACPIMKQDLPLLSCRHKVRVGISTYRDVQEMPSHKTPLLDKKIYKFIAYQGMDVLRSHHGGKTKGNSPLPHPIHSVHDAREHSLSPPGISLLFEPFYTHHGNYVSQLAHLLYSLIIKKSSVSERNKGYIIMLFVDLPHVITDEGLSSQYDHQIKP